MDIIEEKRIQEVRNIVKAMDRRIRKARAACIVPSISDIQALTRAGNILDELLEEFEAEQMAHAAWEEAREDAQGQAHNEACGFEEPITWDTI